MPWASIRAISASARVNPKLGQRRRPLSDLLLGIFDGGEGTGMAEASCRSPSRRCMRTISGRRPLRLSSKISSSPDASRLPSPSTALSRRSKAVRVLLAASVGFAARLICRSGPSNRRIFSIDRWSRGPFGRKTHRRHWPSRRRSPCPLHFTRGYVAHYSRRDHEFPTYAMQTLCLPPAVEDRPRSAAARQSQKIVAG